jgi:hypothetical protein
MTNFPDYITDIEEMYECIWTKYKKEHGNIIKNFWQKSGLSSIRPPVSLIPRITLRGGFIETYRLKFCKQENPNYNIFFIDVNSLYSYIAMENKLPVGKYQVITADQKLNENITFVNNKFYFHGKPLAGSAALVTVQAPKCLFRPFLGYRVEGEYNFYSNCRQCVESKQNSKCNHNVLKSRSFTSAYMISELEKAKQLGYEIIFHELHFYEVTDFILKEFVQILGSQKLKFTDIFKNITDNKIQQCICSNINVGMNFPPHLQLEPSQINPNSAKKLLLKNCLNSFYGRFALHNNRSNHHFCTTKSEFESLLNCENLCVLDFISLSDDVLEVETYCPVTKINPSTKGCLYITSEINALARVFIYEKTEEIEQKGGIILSIDTDAILYALPITQQNHFLFDEAFGSFKHVLGEESEIVSFYSLGPRNYSVVYKEPQHNGFIETKHIVKVKGLSLKSNNCENFLTPDVYSSMIDKKMKNEVQNVYIPQMRKKILPSSKDCLEILTEFNFTNDLHVKRYVNENFFSQSYITFPYGFDYSLSFSEYYVKPSRKRKAIIPKTVSVKKFKKFH